MPKLRFEKTPDKAGYRIVDEYGDTLCYVWVNEHDCYLEFIDGVSLTTLCELVELAKELAVGGSAIEKLVREKEKEENADGKIAEV